jgi:hypothetical protein
MDDIIKYIIEENTCGPIVCKQTLPGLMFADSLTVG